MFILLTRSSLTGAASADNRIHDRYVYNYVVQTDTSSSPGQSNFTIPAILITLVIVALTALTALFLLRAHQRRTRRHRLTLQQGLSPSLSASSFACIGPNASLTDIVVDNGFVLVTVPDVQRSYVRHALEDKFAPSLDHPHVSEKKSMAHSEKGEEHPMLGLMLSASQHPSGLQKRIPTQFSIPSSSPISINRPRALTSPGHVHRTVFNFERLTGAGDTSGCTKSGSMPLLLRLPTSENEVEPPDYLDCGRSGDEVWSGHGDTAQLEAPPSDPTPLSHPPSSSILALLSAAGLINSDEHVSDPKPAPATGTPTSESSYTFARAMMNPYSPFLPNEAPDTTYLSTDPASSESLSTFARAMMCPDSPSSPKVEPSTDLADSGTAELEVVSSYTESLAVADPLSAVSSRVDIFEFSKHENEHEQLEREVGEGDLASLSGGGGAHNDGWEREGSGLSHEIQMFHGEVIHSDSSVAAAVAFIKQADFDAELPKSGSGETFTGSNYSRPSYEHNRQGVAEKEMLLASPAHIVLGYPNAPSPSLALTGAPLDSVAPRYNPTATRTLIRTGHRHSVSANSNTLAIGLGLVGLGLTLGAGHRVPSIPEDDRLAEVRHMYIPSATRTQRIQHRLSTSLPDNSASILPVLPVVRPRPILSIRPPSIHSFMSASSTPADSPPPSCSASPLFLSPLLSASDPLTPLSSAPSSRPPSPYLFSSHDADTPISPDANSLLVKIYYSPSNTPPSLHHRVASSLSPAAEDALETVKFRLARTAVFGELCIKAWEKLGVAVTLTQKTGTGLVGTQDAWTSIGPDEWRDVCAASEERVYFWARDAEQVE